MVDKIIMPDIEKVEICVTPPNPHGGYGLIVYLHHNGGKELTTLFTNDTYSKERAEGFKEWLSGYLPKLTGRRKK